MKLLSIDSPLMKFLSKAADFILMSLLVVTFSIPLFTIGASVTALYCVLIKRSNNCEGAVIPAFWLAFKTNFKNSIVIELLFIPFLLVSAFLVYMIYVGIGDNSVLLLIVCLIPGVLTLMAITYVFPLNAQFDNTPAHTVKNAFFISIGNLPTTLLVSTINLLPALVGFLKFEYFKTMLPFLTLIGFALMAWLIEKILHKVFKQYFPEEQVEKAK